MNFHMMKSSDSCVRIMNHNSFQWKWNENATNSISYHIGLHRYFELELEVMRYKNRQSTRFGEHWTTVNGFVSYFSINLHSSIISLGIFRQIWMKEHEYSTQFLGTQSIIIRFQFIFNVFNKCLNFCCMQYYFASRRFAVDSRNV